MYKFPGFTPKANSAVNHAMTQASILGHTYIGSEHLLLGLLREHSGVAYVVLSQKNVDYDKVVRQLVRTVGKGMTTSLTLENLTERSRRILENAAGQARLMDQPMVGTEHLLMALLLETDSYAVRFLNELNVNHELLYQFLMDTLDGELRELPDASNSLGIGRGKRPMAKAVRPATKTPLLDKFSKDLTWMAQENMLDPVIGRDRELERVVQILSRRSKNNPCLIGEAGVGKTAVAEGLAHSFLHDALPIFWPR